MASIDSAAELRALIASGQLQVDEVIVYKRQAGHEHASVLRDGTIRLDNGTVCHSPTSAIAATGARHSDGWPKWRVPRLGDATLRSLRKSH